MGELVRLSSIKPSQLNPIIKTDHRTLNPGSSDRCLDRGYNNRKINRLIGTFKQLLSMQKYP